MIWQFENLNSSEQNLVLEAPALISILIAGADNEITGTELGRAKEVLNIKAKNAKQELQPYLNAVIADFDSKLTGLRSSLPGDKTGRQEELSRRLEGLNAILPKLDPHFAADLYQSWKDLGVSVAQAEGGLLNAISDTEKEYLKLSMIQKPA